jgi:hypothetical protein
MRRSVSAVVSLLTAAALAFGGLFASAPVAQAAVPQSCTIEATGNWWIFPKDVGTSVFHIVVVEKIVDEGTAGYFCVWIAMDRKPPGKHKIQLDISKPGTDIHAKTTTAWRLVNPKPFKLSVGQKFTAKVRVTIGAPHKKSNKQTITRYLTIDVGSDGVPI